MAQDTLTFIISEIRHNIPIEILELAFKPRKFNTTIENRIISEIVEGPILLDTNLVGGKKRDILLSNQWEMDIPLEDHWNVVGTGVQSSFYKVPAEAREGRNISSVLGVNMAMTSSVPGTSLNYNGSGSFGNTATSMLSEMVNSRTFAQYNVTPQVTLEGTNIIRFHPRQIIDGCAVTVMLEYDASFLNMNQSAILAMCDLCLCATQRYIATRLRVGIDETEVVGGMEIGVVKEIVIDYQQKAERYRELLMKLKGAMAYDSRTLSKLIYFGL